MSRIDYVLFVGVGMKVSYRLSVEQYSGRHPSIQEFNLQTRRLMQCNLQKKQVRDGARVEYHSIPVLVRVFDSVFKISLAAGIKLLGQNLVTSHM